MSMLCRPMWPILLMYRSYDMRHIGFPQVDGGQRDPWDLGPHITYLFTYLIIYYIPVHSFLIIIFCFWHSLVD